MTCPQCNNTFPLTWKRYIKAPFGKLDCPLCNTKLQVTHRWFYWPLMLLGGCILGIPLAILGFLHGLAGGLTGWIIGSFAVGIPFDRFLEIKFSVLKVRDEQSSNKAIDGN